MTPELILGAPQEAFIFVLHHDLSVCCIVLAPSVVTVREDRHFDDQGISLPPAPRLLLSISIMMVYINTGLIIGLAAQGNMTFLI